MIANTQGVPLVSTQFQLQAATSAGAAISSVPGTSAGMDKDSLAKVLQVALQDIHVAIGNLLNIGVPQDVRQTSFFSSELAVLGPFNLASMFQALLGSVLPPEDVDSLAIVASRMALEHYTFLENKDIVIKKDSEFERVVGKRGFTGCYRCGGKHWVKNCPVLK